MWGLSGWPCSGELRWRPVKSEAPGKHLGKDSDWQLKQINLKLGNEACAERHLGVTRI